MISDKAKNQFHLRLSVKTRTLCRLLIVALGLSAALFCRQVRPMSASDPRVKTLMARVSEAKAARLQEVTFAPGASIPAFVPSLEFAAVHFSVLTGSAICKASHKGRKKHGDLVRYGD